MVAPLIYADSHAVKPQAIASWNGLPFEIRSLILKHYISTLLHDANRASIRKQLLDVLTVIKMPEEAVKLAEEVKEEVIDRCEAEDVRLQRINDLIRSYGQSLSAAEDGLVELREARMAVLRNMVQVRVERIGQVVDQWIRLDQLMRPHSFEMGWI